MNPEHPTDTNIIVLHTRNPDHPLEAGPAERVEFGAGPPHDGGMNERIDQLAHSVSELRGTVKGAAWGLGLFAALLAAFLGYMGLQLDSVSDEVRTTSTRLDARMDRIEDKIDGLPGELRGIADSIASAITAARSGQPPVANDLPAETSSGQ